MNYYNEIKKELRNNEIYKNVKDYYKNKNDLETCYNVGKLLIEAQGGEEKAKYGDGLIKEYSKKLTEELNKNFSSTLLKNIRQFYLLSKKSPTLSDKLSWSHYVEIIWLKDINKINYYIHVTEQENLSVRQLRYKIKNKEYERLDDNTKEKFITKQENEIKDFIKHPIIIKNNIEYQEITEKVLQEIILNEMNNFLTELGSGFCYIKNEYKIKIGNEYNYIDILLFNYIYNCFVVVELKTTELKKEHLGQIQVYMNYVNENLKQINQNNTIGIIICKKENKFILEYCSDPRIYETTYMLVSEDIVEYNT